MTDYISFDPAQGSTVDNLIKYAVAPRPICLASTQDQHGNVNLSPFSYFNLFSHNPPICVFSPVRRMRDSSLKHTLENLREVPEVVINVVNYDIVQQQSLASTEYAKEVNEFDKAGLTAISSELISPPRVSESPIQLECLVQQIIDLGQGKGHGSLVVAEVVRMHIKKEMLDVNNQLDQTALDLVARLGGDWYCRTNKSNLFQVPKPLREIGIGVNMLPESIRLSTVLTGNHLGLLANVEAIPSSNDLESLTEIFEVKELMKKYEGNPSTRLVGLHQLAAKHLDKGDVNFAWKILLLA